LLSQNLLSEPKSVLRAKIFSQSQDLLSEPKSAPPSQPNRKNLLPGSSQNLAQDFRTIFAEIWITKFSFCSRFLDHFLDHFLDDFLDDFLHHFLGHFLGAIFSVQKIRATFLGTLPDFRGFHCDDFRGPHFMIFLDHSAAILQPFCKHFAGPFCSRIFEEKKLLQNGFLEHLSWAIERGDWPPKKLPQNGLGQPRKVVI
jgi:hypothetical protein